MPKDLVCGTNVDPSHATHTSEFRGKTYYFSSAECKAAFDADPVYYLSKEENPIPGEGGH